MDRRPVCGGLLCLGGCFVLLLTLQTGDGAISCYECSSHNASDINCEDPFNPAMVSYKTACKVPKKGHIGEFPGNFCIKVSGVRYSGDRLVIRKCALENMENQCGVFKYESESLHGCIVTCNTDGCNPAGRLHPTVGLVLGLVAASIHRFT